MYTRRDVWSLANQQPDGWHPVILAYARAVGRMQSRPASDPTSWAYQAAIHGTHAANTGAGWNQCQHGGWYFLPWHRLYLLYFERIVRAAVVADGGPADWALPYWNYDAGGNANTLPVPFRVPTLPDGSRNPLFVAARAFGINDGSTALPAEITSPARALAVHGFRQPFPGFGGGRTPVEHFWNEPGALEQTPHNDIHVAVGGRGGLMTDPDQAALDPIFWLHHSNIDRLWNVWLRDRHRVPTAKAWRSARFALFDESGQATDDAVTLTLHSASRLDYDYDDAENAEPQDLEGIAAADDEEHEAPERSGMPEMIGASDGPISLSGGAASVDVAIEPPSGPAGLAEEDESRPRRTYLSVEHVDADETPGTVYGVYVGTPDGATRRHVGNVSLFGLAKIHASRDNQDARREMRLVYDVTEIANELGGVRGQDLRVTFEPLTEPGPAGLAAEDQGAEPEVRIGRVSFFTD
jgi:Common central domain of tyrosinase